MVPTLRGKVSTVKWSTFGRPRLLVHHIPRLFRKLWRICRVAPRTEVQILEARLSGRVRPQSKSPEDLKLVFRKKRKRKDWTG